MLRNLDFFGSQIKLRYNKQPMYKSSAGSIITLLIIGFIGFRFISIVLSVFYRENPSLIFTERQVDDPSLFTATARTFPLAFALEDSNNNFFIDEQIYTIQAQLQQKFQVYNKTSLKYDAVYKMMNIAVLPCTTENFQNPDNAKYYLKLDYKNMYCFTPDYQLDIQGDFPSPVFSQIMLKVFKCKTNCKSDYIVDKYLKKIYFGLQFSDAYVDITNKDNPFQMYSRDIFWPISSQQQKDVTLYIRNNYVYSDFGWFFSDVKTQRFPSFSFQNIDVFPVQNQGDYLLSVTFRFEKQQENVYRRSYLDFFGIISQIGGFANTLFAIGFLICHRVSELQLNQNIISQIFSYKESQIENNKQQEISEATEQKQDNQTQQPPLEYQTQLKNKNNNSEQKQEMNQIIQCIQENTNNKSICPHSQSISNLNRNLQKKEKLNQNISNFSKKKPTFISKLNSNQEISKQNNLESQNFSRIFILNKYLQDETPNQSISSITNNNSPNNQNKTPQNMNTKEEKEFTKLFNQQTNSMKMSVWEYFLSYICPFGKLKKKKEIIQYSIDKLYQNLDILQILKRLIEVEKLKRLLLDPDQIKLLDYLPKPTIDLDLILDKQSTENAYKNKEVNLLYQDNRCEIQKARDAFEAYKKIKHKQNFTLLDKKIIEMLDQNLVQIFEAQQDNLSLGCIQNKQNNNIKQKTQNSSPFLKLQNEKNKNVDQESQQTIKIQETTNFFASQYDNPRPFEFNRFQSTQQQSINNYKDSFIENQEFAFQQNCNSDSEQGEIAQEDFRNNIPDQLQSYNIC